MKTPLLLLASSLFCASLAAIDNPVLPSTLEGRETTWNFLENMANAELMEQSIDGAQSIRNRLNALNDSIMESGDLPLIHLYNRAVRNFNSLSPFKANAVTTYYKHYEAPAYKIPDINLTFIVETSHVDVITKLTIERQRKEQLILDGRGHQVHEIRINDRLVSREKYYVTPHEVVFLETPDADCFTVEIASRIDPFNNTSLEGMYVCGDWLTTQCESEGARAIFYTLDRPDVLSRIKTTIIADPIKYPYRLSNGNLIKEKKLDNGRSTITWEDPIPKPSYLFACVMGNFSLLSDSFVTRSGRKVDLQVYLEPGKEARGGYSLEALKKAMEFDELFFDREYDLDCLKMVGIPDFNSGAMENKGLMIFNDIRLLIDAESGTDSAFRDVAAVVGHEYFHNWSGNRVTVRNWFEIALKEAFTDWRAIRFVEWLFGEEFIRPKDVRVLREAQFPEEISEKGHPIMVESYVDAHSIYDSTTYVKGREVFRTFQLYVDSLISGGFREALNLYFEKNDGKAVTFRELLSAADEILARVGKDSSQFERWFFQPGTPVVEVKMFYNQDKGEAQFIVSQTCCHPKTKAPQLPFVIPFSIELLGKKGVIATKEKSILDTETAVFTFPASERPTPLFMHGYSAPVILQYDYSAEDLARIMKYTDDAFNRWEASQKYSLLVLKEMMAASEQLSHVENHFSDLLSAYSEALKEENLSPLAKAQLLQIPTVRAISQALNNFDFAKLAKLQSQLKKQIALACRSSLVKIVDTYRVKEKYAPTTDQMQRRELYNTCLSFLSLIDPKFQEIVSAQYDEADNFNDQMAAFTICIANDCPCKQPVVQAFQKRWKNDKAVFNYWLSAQANMPNCTVEDLKRLETANGYDAKNPNHIRSIIRAFIANLGCYHDPEGNGYRYVVDKILEVAQFNPSLAHNNLAVPAVQDFDHLPAEQRALLRQELLRLKSDAAPPQTRDLVNRILK